MTKSKMPPAPLNTKEPRAQMACDNSLNAAAVMEKFANIFGEQDAMALRQTVHQGVTKVQNGDLQECEAMLYGQALALQSMFVSLARRSQTQEYLKQYELYFRLALKAQSQCRATLETLATLKSPQVVFAKQANISNGPQQVNNGVSSESALPSHARKHDFEQNELLEQHREIALDTRKTGPAKSSHLSASAMAEINRPKKRSR